MKKKIVVLALALCLVLSLSVVASASSGTMIYGELTAPSIDGIVSANPDYPYAIISGTKLILVSNIAGKSGYASISGDRLEYKLVDGRWEFVELKTGTFTTNYSNIDWTSHDITYNGNVIIEHIAPVLLKVGFNNFMAYAEKLVEQINVKSVLQVLVVGIGSVVGLVFMWWGSRKLVRGIMAAFKKGKISL